MAPNNLMEVYLAECVDMYGACKQSQEAVRALADMAQDQELKQALQAGMAGIEDGTKKVEAMIQKHGGQPEEANVAMRGLVEEAKKHATEQKYPSSAAQDAAIISQYQRLTHYAMAGWGAAAAHAKQAGLEDEARVLKENCENTATGDQHMNAMATSRVNPKAAENRDALMALYLEECLDLYSACRQCLPVMRQLAEKAKDTELQQAMQKDIAGIQESIGRLEGIVRRHGKDPGEETCKGMQGLVKEAHQRVLAEDMPEGSVRDAVIISQHQHMAHYAIAGYGCAAAYAQQLGLQQEADGLKADLAGTRHGNERLKALAKDRVNPAAAGQ